MFSTFAGYIMDGLQIDVCRLLVGKQEGGSAFRTWQLMAFRSKCLQLLRQDGRHVDRCLDGCDGSKLFSPYHTSNATAHSGPGYPTSLYAFYTPNQWSWDASLFPEQPFPSPFQKRPE